MKIKSYYIKCKQNVRINNGGNDIGHERKALEYPRPHLSRALAHLPRHSISTDIELGKDNRYDSSAVLGNPSRKFTVELSGFRQKLMASGETIMSVGRRPGGNVTHSRMSFITIIYQGIPPLI